MTQHGQADFWTNPDSNSDNPVVAHTPDPTKYHYPDAQQGLLMRGSVVGPGVVIPRANNDGTSKGFDGRVAGVVHVDPDAPDGGTIVDCTQLNAGVLNNALSQSNYPHEVFYKLGTAPQNYNNQAQPKAQSPEQPRVNPHVPSGSYIAPASAADGTQLMQQPFTGGNNVDPIPTLPAPQQQFQAPAPAPAPIPVQQLAPVQQVAAPAPQPVPVQQLPVQAPVPVQVAVPAPQPYYPPVQPVAPDPNIAALAAQVTQLTQVVGSLAAAPAIPPGQYNPQQQPPGASLQTVPQMPNNAPAPLTPQVVPQNNEEYTPTQTLTQIEDESKQERAREGVVVGFETLMIPFITGPIPNKAKKDVFFEIPGAGTMSAKFHHIEDGGQTLALVYDTRYEDGNQYLPPDLGEQEIKVQIPKLKKTFICKSLGLHFAVGVLDIVVLIKNVDAPEPSDYEEE